MRERKYRIVVVECEGRGEVEFKVAPSAQDKIKHDLRQATAKRRITNDYERGVAEVALTAAAIEKATEAGTREVTAPHVKMGWRENLCIAPKVCIPASTCIRRSVIERVEELKNRSEVFRVMVSKSG